METSSAKDNVDDTFITANNVDARQYKAISCLVLQGKARMDDPLYVLKHLIVYLCEQMVRLSLLDFNLVYCIGCLVKRTDERRTLGHDLSVITTANAANAATMKQNTHSRTACSKPSSSFGLTVS